MGHCFSKNNKASELDVNEKRNTEGLDAGRHQQRTQEPVVQQYKPPAQQSHPLPARRPAQAQAPSPVKPSSLTPKPKPVHLIDTILGKPFEDVRAHYSIGKELGRGQFGVTYLCTEISTGHTYACKSISKRKLVNKNDKEDIKREIQIMQHLTGQPNIVEFKGAYEDKQSVHLVMELCAGGEGLICVQSKKTRASSARTMATGTVQEVRPPALDATSEPPPVFDGTTRLYIAYTCPYAQRPWITRNYKGLQDKIKLVPIDLWNRPAWYKEKVYPENKVPALEHNNQMKGESLELVKYIDSNFEGPSLLPDDPAKREFAEELLAYTDKFSGGVFASLKGDADASSPFDYLETALQKFTDGPFFLGHEFSQVDVAYVPFVERFQLLLLDVKKYDITIGRPNLTSWIEALDKIEAYKQTKYDPKELVEILKIIYQLK